MITIKTFERLLTINYNCKMLIYLVQYGYSKIEKKNTYFLFKLKTTFYLYHATTS